ncbi:MAG: efflux family protein [Verrucomicrobiaceae bacterium]|nr:efflux family protein [Verrucomicrobiaceae bacterium]
MRPVSADTPLWKTFLIFLGPLMLSNILQALSGTLNNIFIGQMIGVEALAAVSAIFPLLFFCIAFVMGLGAGAPVLIGQAYGARELDKVKAVAGTTLTVVIVLGVAVALAGGFFAEPLLRVLGTPANILSDATAYARVMLIAMPALFLFLLVTSMTRGVGDTKTPLIALAISTTSGLLLTPSLIRGWFGLPMLGIQSAAVASVIATLIALIWIFWHMRRAKHPLAPDAELLRHMYVDWKILRVVLRMGLPTGVQMIVMSLAEIALLSFVNQFGSNATAAYGAVNQVLNYVQFPAMSIAITASILGAQAIGGGQIRRLRAITRTGIALNFVITGSLIGLAYLFSRAIIGCFVTSAAVIEMAQTLLHIVLWSVVLFGVSAVLSGVMRASGTVIAPTAISILAIIAVEVPVAYVLSQRIGINGIWMAYPVFFSSLLALQLAFYWFIWRHKTISKLI